MSDDFEKDEKVEDTGEVEETHEEPEFEPFYSSLDAWVTDWLLPNYSRPLRDVSKFV